MSAETIEPTEAGRPADGAAEHGPYIGERRLGARILHLRVLGAGELLDACAASARQVGPGARALELGCQLLARAFVALDWQPFPPYDQEPAAGGDEAARAAPEEALAARLAIVRTIPEPLIGPLAGRYAEIAEEYRAWVLGRPGAATPDEPAAELA